MPVLAVANELTDYAVAFPGCIPSTSTSFRYTDQSRMSLGSGTDHWCQLDFSSAVSSFWMRGAIRTPSTYQSSAVVLLFRNGTNNAFRLIRVSNDSFLTFQGWTGSAWSNIATTDVNPPSSTLMPFFIRITAGVSGTVTIQFGNPVLASLSFTGNTVYTGNVNNVRLLGFNDVAAPTYYSSIIVADENCFNWVTCALAPDGAGATNDWGGSHSDVNNATDPYAAWIQTNATGQLVLFSATDIPGAFSSASVVAVSLSSLSRRGTSATPTNLRHVIRTGSNNYSSSNLGPTEFISSRRTLWHTNPATSAAWTQAEVNALQIGVESV